MIGELALEGVDLGSAVAVEPTALLHLPVEQAQNRRALLRADHDAPGHRVGPDWRAAVDGEDVDQSHPFRPVRVMPATNCFCIAKKTISTGMMMKVAAAISSL